MTRTTYDLSGFDMEDLLALKAVKNGADVYSYGLAGRLRGLQRSGFDGIVFTDPQMYQGDGSDQTPYFGAILRDDCKKALNVELKARQNKEVSL